LTVGVAVSVGLAEGDALYGLTVQRLTHSSPAEMVVRPSDALGFIIMQEITDGKYFLK